MSVHTRICAKCGESERTGSYAPTCHKCHWETKQEKAAQEERLKLESLGYQDIEGPSFQQTKHRSWTFTHAECGTVQTWRYGNILKQLRARPDSVPCSKCGGKERMAKAMEAYIEEYGRDFDTGLWEEYKIAARRMSERTYQAHKHEINPLNLKRGYRTYHLDHKMPIIEGFLQGIPVEVIAAKENLQILKAEMNLSKGRKREQHT